MCVCGYVCARVFVWRERERASVGLFTYENNIIIQY